jgi:hypothetical protein
VAGEAAYDWWMPDDPAEFVPPTYDLRELGEGPAISERLEALADRMLAVAGEEVGCAFARVPVFAERARGEGARRDEYYRRTTRERYLAELFACVVMNRQFWPEFASRRDTVLILPDCLRRRGDECERKGSRAGTRCTACDETCAVGRMTVAAAKRGAGAFFAIRDHGRQFRRLQRDRFKDLSVIGVACIWMLASGMREAEGAGVPSQGVLLNYCGCDHWADKPHITDTVVERVVGILDAKARARAESRIES